MNSDGYIIIQYEKMKNDYSTIQATRNQTICLYIYKYFFYFSTEKKLCHAETDSTILFLIISPKLAVES